MKRAVIVTGLPACGKTTVAREVSKRLDFQLFDKDDFLEALYESESVSSWGHRKTLSRKSDLAFQAAAKTSDCAVLVSHWRPPGSPAESGTPSDWLEREYDLLVEVCCLCLPEEALRRFIARTRHPGHLDNQRDAKELAERLDALDKRFPLKLGRWLEVRTDVEVDFEKLTEDVQRALSRNA